MRVLWLGCVLVGVAGSVWAASPSNIGGENTAPVAQRAKNLQEMSKRVARQAEQIQALLQELSENDENLRAFHREEDTLKEQKQDLFESAGKAGELGSDDEWVMVDHISSDQKALEDERAQFRQEKEAFDRYNQQVQKDRMDKERALEDWAKALAEGHRGLAEREKKAAESLTKKIQEERAKWRKENQANFRKQKGEVSKAYKKLRQDRLAFEQWMEREKAHLSAQEKASLEQIEKKMQILREGNTQALRTALELREREKKAREQEEAASEAWDEAMARLEQLADEERD
jgi:chromosome segregation ATPase